MKKIIYKDKMEVNRGTKDNPQIENVYVDRFIPSQNAYFADNLAIAQAAAYNGEVTVEDVPDEPKEPTQEEQLRADVDFLSVMTGVTL